ncbi:T9SS type A sorting domain-containing protein [Leptobacterium sp. I13]|uniref:T9SS type A sorting domain-containing protein n=1 Tax=Leptobacterium meishanense TaxID=3128904 RepID=UPI0030EC176C
MKKIIVPFLLFCFLFYFKTQAQSLQPQVFSTSGEQYKNPSLLISWTIGEPFIETLKDTNNNYILTQGFQQPGNPLMVEAIVENIGCEGGASGRITLIASGGIPPYSYSWTTNSIPIGGNTPFIENLTAGIYDVLVTDALGAPYTNTFNITNNDDISNAVLIPDIRNWCSSLRAFCNIGATIEANNPAPSCWVNGNNSPIGPNADKWFKFTATATGKVEVILKTNYVDGIQYGMLALWDNTLTNIITCTPPQGQLINVRIATNNLTEGETYYIQVDNNNRKSFYTGFFGICVSETISHDFIEGAIDLTNNIAAEGGTWCSDVRAYTTEDGTIEPNNPEPACWVQGTTRIGPKNDKWFKFTATATGEIEAVLKTNFNDGIQYGMLALWDSTFTNMIACTSPQGQLVDTKLTANNLVEGETYFIQVDSSNQKKGGTGPFGLCVSETISPMVVSQTLNESSVAVETNIKIVPNPNNGRFNLILHGLPQQEYFKIEIVSTLGTLVYSEQVYLGKGITSYQKNINLQQHAQGIYEVRIDIPGEPLSYQKVIIKK